MQRFLAIIALATLSLLAQAVPPARAQQPFHGTLTLNVDTSDIDHQIFDIHETIPVHHAGQMTLLYPQWEIGSHGPTASVTGLAGLVLQADGKPLAWKRDRHDAHAFHIVVPVGVETINVHMQFLAPTQSTLISKDLVALPWHRLLVYPGGWPTHAIPIRASIVLPPGLSLAGPLNVLRQDGTHVELGALPLDELVDAPSYAARYRRVVPLAQPDGKPVVIDMVSSKPNSLDLAESDITRLRAMIAETGHVFGPAPFKRYHALAILRDETAGGGIEHLEEGENFLPEDYFTDPSHQLANADLIAHEYVHAWNGRYAIPADLWAADYNSPQSGSLLWVYEGQTEMWGRVLAARAGQRSVQQTLDRLAMDAALVANRPARVWKSLDDSLNDTQYMIGTTVSWRDWQRREDYYPEGVLLWLDVEARMRELSANRAGLDDFARRFFDTSTHTAPALYRFDDVVHTLNSLVANDWRDFLKRHLETHHDEDAMAALGRMGWRLAYSNTPSDSWRQEEAVWNARDLSYSIGLQVRSNGSLASVAWNGPAFKAGLAPGAKIVSVNGAPFTPEGIEQAVARASEVPVVLDVVLRGESRNVILNYHGTLRYPYLERVNGTIDRLSSFLAPRVSQR